MQSGREGEDPRNSLFRLPRSSSYFGGSVYMGGIPGGPPNYLWIGCKNGGIPVPWQAVSVDSSGPKAVFRDPHPGKNPPSDWDT